MTVNIAGRLLDFAEPMVMGILNVTPDSFYAASRTEGAEAVRARAAQILAEGAAIIDVGAFSTRPGAAEVTEEEEIRRLAGALAVIRREWPGALVSIDTFRPSVARCCIHDFGAAIINDVSGGSAAMFETVADLRVPYILTHSGGKADDAIAAAETSAAGTTAPGVTVPDEATFMADMARFFAGRLQQLYELGVADVILDPGFGFGKTQAQNYVVMRHLTDLIALFPDNPMLVGISRKSMIWRLLDTTPDGALNGTTVLNTLALQAGAHILRVHDVREAVEAVRVVGRLKNSKIQGFKD
ncbi:MAG: dihydropteroate synthase [Bacteroidaceae bacterium]|nr:dihydropteroate synthase [Bacteroidaceae bacterium]